jgi:hypothetical protein
MPIYTTNYQEHSGKKKDSRYFGSDLNKFIHENCSKQMTVNNIDLIMLKFRDYGKHTLRIIESKHVNEKPMSSSQRKVLELVKKVFALAQKQMTFGIDLELFLVTGSQPYDKLHIVDMMKEESFEVSGKESVIKWLNM